MKRIAVTLLWFYSAWTLGSFITAALGMPDIFALALGFAGGAVVVLDPKHRIWRPTAGSTVNAEPAKA